jgi:hypothetical protein
MLFWLPRFSKHARFRPSASLKAAIAIAAAATQVEPQTKPSPTLTQSQIGNFNNEKCPVYPPRAFSINL